MGSTAPAYGAANAGRICRRPGRIQRIIYVKTPRTAGTSVREALLETLQPATLVDGKSFPFPSRRRLRRSRLIVVGDVVATRLRRRFPRIWSESHSFAIVRDPYDRLVSAWKYCPSTRELSLLEALAGGRPRKRWWRCYDHDFVHFTMRQSDFLVEDGCIIVGAVLRFEHLHHELEAFFRGIGIELPALPHRNRSERPREVLSQLCPDTLAVANHHFAPDFEHFGYRRVEPGSGGDQLPGRFSGGSGGAR